MWNLDSLPSRNFSKIPLVEGIQNMHDFDVFGICETYLNDEHTLEDIQIKGFSEKPFRSDSKLANCHKQGGVALYYKSDLPIRERKELNTLDECIVSEIRLKNEKMFFVLLYRSPSQKTSTEVQTYVNSLENLMDNLIKEKPSCIILTGDFNSRSPLIWAGEITEEIPGRMIANFANTNNLDQLINEPTHLPRGDIATCIDLIFTNQPYLFVDSGVISSPDEKCKHQIIHGKVNFEIPVPPKYVRKMWDFPDGNYDAIKNEMWSVDWDFLLQGKNVNQMVDDFNSIFKNIIDANIPSRSVTINDRDAPWINNIVKTGLARNKRVYRSWIKRGRPNGGIEYVKSVQKETKNIINGAKSDFFSKLSKKLCDPQTGQREFWGAYKRILNKKKNTNIPPLLENGRFVTDFNEKAKIFNSFFAQQCRPLDMISNIPTFFRRTNNTIDSVIVNSEMIISIIKKMNAKKAHGFDGISIKMLQICPDEVSVPLSIIFKKCLETGSFPSKWKSANVQPVHKKGSRQEKNNYRPISLLPVCSKIFEKIIFDNIYKFLIENNLISPNQSGFRPGDSTINQLLSITTEIYEAFENGAEIRASFLDISKAFDKVWHEGLLFKLKTNGIDGSLLALLGNYLTDRNQRVVLNGLQSSWEHVYAGVPQGSVLGPLLFLIYINDLTDGIISNIKLFADDSSLFARVQDIDNTHNQLLTDLDTITQWANQWKMKFNPDLTKQAIEVIFSHKYKKPFHPPLVFNGIPVARQDSTKHLGMILDEHLSFRKHLKEAIEKANKGINLMKYLSKYVNRKTLDVSYKMYVRPHLDYGDIIYHGQLVDMMKSVESVQYQAALITTKCIKGTSRQKLYNELGWESLEERRIFRRFVLFYKIMNNETPDYLRNHLAVLPERRTQRYDKSFFPFCQLNWDSLSDELKNATSVSVFKAIYLKNIRPQKQNTFDVRDKYGLSLLTRLRVDFSDLRDHRFRHNWNCANPTCRCNRENETTVHFLLRCPIFNGHRRALLSALSDILKIDEVLLESLSSATMVDLLLYGSKEYNIITNRLILEATIRYVLSTGRFKTIEAYEVLI